MLPSGWRLAQHIPLLGYKLLRSPWELLEGFMKTTLTGCYDTTHGQPSVQFPGHCWSYASSWTQCCVQVLCLHKLQINRQMTMNIWWFNTYFPKVPCGTYMPIIIAFHFATLIRALPPLDLVIMQQFFTGVQD